MNFFKKSFPKIKNILFFALIAIFISLEFAFPLPVSAGLITSTLLALPGIVLAIMGFFANLWAQLAIIVFNWVTGPTFITWGYTKNPVIEIGLGITKQFVNLGLVVALVFIALATALRLKEYAAQKTLARLVIIALLVNFAPVICGLIVDAANIVMNYFLAGITKGSADMFNNIKGSFGTFSDMLNPKYAPNEQLGLFGKLAASLILNYVIAFTFLLLAAIFLMRYIAIWILVILAPLAFVAWILPATKKFWDQWWQQFIQWSIIGIPIAFFLYLAMASFSAISINFGNKMEMPGLSPEVSPAVNYFNEFFAYFVVVILIWLGIVIGLQTSAMGATSIINFTKSKGRATAGWAGRQGWKATKTTGAAMAGAIKGAREGEGIKGRIGGAFSGAATFGGREKGRESMGKILERMHLVRPGAYEESRRKRWKIEDEVKRLKTLPTDRLHDITQRKILRPADRASSIAAFELLAERSSLKDKEKDLLPIMQSFGADTSKVLKARPDWTPPKIKEGETKEQAIKKQVATSTPKDFAKNTQAEALYNAEVIMSLDIPKIQYIGLHGTAKQKTALSQSATSQTATLKDITDRVNQLAAKGTAEAQAEADRIIGVVKAIYSNPNIKAAQ